MSALSLFASIKEGMIVNFDNMTKEELIDYIQKMQTQRAFSEEDQFLLKILDDSPFTIWASDRNCIIKFWEGQCELLYGYKKEQALGKDFVDLFVAEDEKKAAREDQLKIIDSGEVFHNIANDVAKNGNTLRLLTNCWRMKDPHSDEYWNVEMGLIVDFFYQELERLEEIITESRLYKARVTQFIELTKYLRKQFAERKKVFNDAIRECDRKSVIAKKRTEFKKRTEPVKKSIKQIEEQMSELIDEYLHKIQVSGSATECEELTDKFKESYEVILDKFEDIVTDFQEVNVEFSTDGVIIGKDSILKDTALEHEKYHVMAFNLKISISKQIDSIRAQVTVNKSSTLLQFYVELQDSIDAIMKEINTIQERIYKEISIVQTYNGVIEIRKNMLTEYEKVGKRINEIYETFKKGKR